GGLPMSRRCAYLCLMTVFALASAPVQGGGPAPQPAKAAVDLFGDPLPPGAVARLGTVRLRHADTLDHVAFSPDGKALLSLAADHVLRFWDPATGRPLRKAGTDDSVVGGPCALSADGKLLAGGGWDKVHLLDAAT